jgi:hypothetical protein
LSTRLNSERVMMSFTAARTRGSAAPAPLECPRSEA